jgi:hypothetical protein
MGFVNIKSNPQKVYEGNSKEDLAKINRWVSNINKDLRDSGFEEHQAKVELVGKNAYIKSYK